MVCPLRFSVTPSAPMLSPSPDASQVRLLVSVVLLVSTAPHCTAAEADDQGVSAASTPPTVTTANRDSVLRAGMRAPFVRSGVRFTIDGHSANHQHGGRLPASGLDRGMKVPVLDDGTGRTPWTTTWSP